tara:strand:- start:3220 stop:3615 length:396 start_codon:yes stop_codon:yes gene_type:complete
MKIELRHLAPYLPYGLSYQDSKGNVKIMKSLDSIINMVDFGHGDAQEIKEVKPILRPLSDLKENLELKENLYKSHKINMYWHKWEALENKNNYKELEYLPKCIFDMLVEHHFDVFGLIDKGLAIDINTIKE